MTGAREYLLTTILHQPSSLGSLQLHNPLKKHNVTVLEIIRGTDSHSQRTRCSQNHHHSNRKRPCLDPLCTSFRQQQQLPSFIVSKLFSYLGQLLSVCVFWSTSHWLCLIQRKGQEYGVFGSSASALKKPPRGH